MKQLSLLLLLTLGFCGCKHARLGTAWHRGFDERGRDSEQVVPMVEFGPETKKPHNVSAEDLKR